MNQDNCQRTEVPKMLEISEILEEGKGQTSFFFNHQMQCRPGQFVMVWLPGVDEKPMAVSYHSKNEFAFTSQSVGKFTSALGNLRRGDRLGIRGPYGNSFSLKENACVVAGGVGMSSVSTLIDVLKNPTIIYGARSKEHLIYLKRYKNKKMLITTDDGSFGREGFTTDALDELLSKNKTQENQRFSGRRKSSGFSSEIKTVYTCGPEIMMKKVFDICQRHKVNLEASVERYMSCGFGICGKCMVNDKIACIDGPIFTSSQLAKMTEFGSFARLKSGRKVSLKEYHSVHN